MTLKYIWATKTNETKATDYEGAGQLRHDDFGYFYRWVKNVDAVTLPKGSAVCFDVAQANAADIERSVKTPATANLKMFAGIVCADDGIAAGQYGWVMCFGYCDFANVLGPASAGGTAADVGRYYKPVNGQLYLSDDGATITQIRTAQMAQAIALTASPAAAPAKVFIRAL